MSSEPIRQTDPRFHLRLHSFLPSLVVQKMLPSSPFSQELLAFQTLNLAVQYQCYLHKSLHLHELSSSSLEQSHKALVFVPCRPCTRFLLLCVPKSFRKVALHLLHFYCKKHKFPYTYSCIGCTVRCSSQFLCSIPIPLFLKMVMVCSPSPSSLSFCILYHSNYSMPHSHQIHTYSHTPSLHPHILLSSFLYSTFLLFVPSTYFNFLFSIFFEASPRFSRELRFTNFCQNFYKV